MSHPDLTAMAATQHGRDLQRRSAHARRVTPAGAHGIRVVSPTAPPPGRRRAWPRVVVRTAFRTT